MRVFLSLGSNLGDRETYLQGACNELAKIGDIHAVTAHIETKAVDVVDQPDFLNAVVEFHTELTPMELLREVHVIEEKFGRERTIPKGPRTLDIDILLYGDEHIEEPELTVPHPELMNRKFLRKLLVTLSPELSQYRLPYHDDEIFS